MFNTSHNQNIVEQKNIETYIGQTVKIEGHIKSEGNISVAGEVKGSISTKQDIIINEGAKVNGNVSGLNITISGLVSGNVKSQGDLDLKKSAKIVGDIETKNLNVSSGAIISGQIKMENVDLKTSRVVENLETSVADKKIKFSKPQS